MSEMCEYFSKLRAAVGCLLVLSALTAEAQLWNPDSAGVQAGAAVSAHNGSNTAHSALFAGKAATNHVHTGTYQPADSDLDDLADGSLTGSKIGSGIAAGNITSGTVTGSRLPIYTGPGSTGAVAAASGYIDTTLFLGHGGTWTDPNKTSTERLSVWQNALVLNGAFTNASSWTVSGSAVIGYGKLALLGLIPPTYGPGTASQTLTAEVVSGHVYTVQFDLRTVYNPSFPTTLPVTIGSDGLAASPIADSVWRTVSLEIPCTASGPADLVIGYDSPTTGRFQHEIDNILVWDSTETISIEPTEIKMPGDVKITRAKVESWLTAETDPDLAAQNADTLDPTGFADPSAVTVAYNTNRTITLTQAGGVDVWWRGTNFVLSSPWTSTAHATNYTGYYLSFSTGTNATWSTDAWTLDKGQIAYVQYAAAYKLAWRETHGMSMDWRTHEELHRNIGTYRVSGLTPVATTYSVNGAGAANSNNTPGFASGVIQDEDLPTTIDAWPQDLYTTLHFTGSGTPVFTTNATSFVRVTGTYPNVNAYSSGTFSEAETVQNRWLNYYAAFLPMAADTVSQRYRVVIIQPQVAHSSLTAAQAEDYRSLQLAGLTALGPEMIAFVRFTFRTSSSYSTTGKVRIESVTYLTGSQGSQTVITSLVTPSSADAISVSTTATNYTRAANNVESALTGIDSRLGAIPAGNITSGNVGWQRITNALVQGYPRYVAVVAANTPGTNTTTLKWGYDNWISYGATNSGAVCKIDIPAIDTNYCQFAMLTLINANSKSVSYADSGNIYWASNGLWTTTARALGKYGRVSIATMGSKYEAILIATNSASVGYP